MKGKNIFKIVVTSNRLLLNLDGLENLLINALSFYVMYDFNSKKRLNRKRVRKEFFIFR